jgi:hypothetical protein
MEAESSLPCLQEPSTTLYPEPDQSSPYLSPMPYPQAKGPPLVGCPRLFIQYIRSYPPYLEAISSIRNQRTCHAVVTSDPPNMASPNNISRYMKVK